MTKIEFTRDFATKKKGDVIEVDSVRAAVLIGKKVAKQWKKPAKKTQKKSE